MSALGSSNQSPPEHPQHRDFDISQPSVYIPGELNAGIRANFRPSKYKDPAKNDWQKLSTSLSELLAKREVTHLKNKSTAMRAFEEPYWELDATGDAISRFFEVESEGMAEEIIQKIGKVADEMNHHPDIKKEPLGNERGGSQRLSVTCCTHRPPGLSMKDVNLARKINEILSLYHLPPPEKSSSGI